MASSLFSEVGEGEDVGGEEEDFVIGGVDVDGIADVRREDNVDTLAEDDDDDEEGIITSGCICRLLSLVSRYEVVVLVAWLLWGTSPTMECMDTIKPVVMLAALLLALWYLDLV